MKRSFYYKLAASNLKKNAKIYTPYTIAAMCTVMMFYIMIYLANNEALGHMSGGRTLGAILWLGIFVIGIFAVIFLFYTNSFNIKRRKKEIGLFNILGMEKRHIARVMAAENTYIALISIIGGLLCGILFSKLMLLFLGKLVGMNVVFGFSISVIGIITTTLTFTGIFTLTLLYNLRRIHVAKPVELMRGGSEGEREPKTKWPLAVIGVLTLGAGYAMSIMTKSAVMVIGLFFIAVILVIIGTYCLFTSGSIAALKIMRSNKKYYYKISHFTTVSGLLYRMKQNAAGLANICILSTMVLVMISTTASLYFGFDGAIIDRFPRNLQYEINGDTSVTQEDAQKIDGIIDERLTDAENLVKCRYSSIMLNRHGDDFTSEQSENGIASVVLIPLESYEKLSGRTVELGDGEILAYTPNGKPINDEVSLNGETYSVAEKLAKIELPDSESTLYNETYYFVVKNDEAIEKVRENLNNGSYGSIVYMFEFDLPYGSKEQVEFYNAFGKYLSDSGVKSFSSVCAAAFADELYSLYGGLFFLGIFLGSLFLIATVLIIYYKQISEGYDDKQRFEIMQKVGMSRSEVKGAIRSQVLTVFFLPLVTAMIHIAFAFPMIQRMMALLNLTDVGLFIFGTLVTVAVFTVFYVVIYTLTARTYYKIVE